MKLKNYLMGFLGAIAFAACSSDNPADNGGAESPDYGYGENYVSVSIEMPTASGSRVAGQGDNDTDKFDYGTDWESAVRHVVFFFFDGENKCIDIQLLSASDFKAPEASQTNDNPNIANWGTVEVRLKPGYSWENKKIAVAINTPVSDVNRLATDIKTFEDLKNRAMDYAEEILKEVNDDDSEELKKMEGKNGMVMSSSVYYKGTDHTTQPVESNKVCLVEITKDNIYTSAERSNLNQLIKEGKKKYVDVFVERVVARVDVKAIVFDDNAFYVLDENNQEQKTIKIFNHSNNTTNEIKVRPVIKGMVVNVLAPKTKLIKPLSVNQVGYEVGDGDYKSFKWNDPINKRSYWASTSFESSDAMEYISWDQTEGKNVKDNNLVNFSQYINPNTQDFAPDFEGGIRSNEGGSRNTKVMVIAELHKFEEHGTHEALDLVKYASEYTTPALLLAHIANQINIALRNHSWKSNDFEIPDVSNENGESKTVKRGLNEAELKNVAAVVHNSFIGDDNYGITAGQLELVTLNPGEIKDGKKKPGKADWEAKISMKNEDSFTLNNNDSDNKPILSDNLLNLVREKVKKLIANTLETFNAPQILYWNNGKTYYFTNIRHQGFYGLVGNSTAENSTDFLYGVVRNHIYNINLDGVYGLGTPVIEPDRPINPDRPTNERPSYIKARIKILPWRVVNNTATIH